MPNISESVNVIGGALFLEGGTGPTECKILRLNLHRPQPAMLVIQLPKVKLALFRQH